MHHSEIGKIVDIFQELHILSTDPHPVKISAYPVGTKGLMGIKIRADLANGSVQVVMNSADEDSNGIDVSYFKERSHKKPARSFAWRSNKTLPVALLGEFMKKLALADRGIGDIELLKVPDF